MFLSFQYNYHLFFFTTSLSLCSISVKKHIDQGNLEEKNLIGALLQGFQGLVHDHHDGEHDSGQT